jgi:hypothetical protein
MSAITYRNGSYHCSECDDKVRVPAGSCVRHSYTTVQDGERERLLLVDGAEAHRCIARDTTTLAGAGRPGRR